MASKFINSSKIIISAVGQTIKPVIITWIISMIFFIIGSYLFYKNSNWTVPENLGFFDKFKFNLKQAFEYNWANGLLIIVSILSFPASIFLGFKLFVPKLIQIVINNDIGNYVFGLGSKWLAKLIDLQPQTWKRNIGSGLDSIQGLAEINDEQDKSYVKLIKYIYKWGLSKIYIGDIDFHKKSSLESATEVTTKIQTLISDRLAPSNLLFNILVGAQFLLLIIAIVKMYYF